jgi:hypothetical protein
MASPAASRGGQMCLLYSPAPGAPVVSFLRDWRANFSTFRVPNADV